MYLLPVHLLLDNELVWLCLSIDKSGRELHHIILLSFFVVQIIKCSVFFVTISICKDCLQPDVHDMMSLILLILIDFT